MDGDLGIADHRKEFMLNVVKQSRTSRRVFAGAIRSVLESLEQRRMLSASTLDQTYNGSGIVLNDFNTNGTGSGAAIQADDKVVVGGGDVNANPGTVQIDIERYTTQGTLDPTFGTNGQFTLARG